MNLPSVTLQLEVLQVLQLEVLQVLQLPQRMQCRRCLLRFFCLGSHFLLILIRATSAHFTCRNLAKAYQKPFPELKTFPGFLLTIRSEPFLGILRDSGIFQILTWIFLSN